MAEQWRAIPGYAGRYDVSDQGRVRSYMNGRGWDSGRVSRTPRRILGPWRNGAGYLLVELSDDAGARTTHRVHRLVLIAFTGPCPSGLECNHLDGDKGNNALSNLEWVSHSENMRHAFDNGLNDNRGEMHPSAKLTEADARDIRDLYAMGVHTQMALGRRFGVTRATISDVVRGKSWPNVGSVTCACPKKRRLEP